VVNSQKVVIVTGGAGGEAGLGLTTTEFLARAGYVVVVWDLRDDAIEQAKKELGDLANGILFQQLDVSDEEQVSHAYIETRAKVGPAFGLVNNAAIKMAGIRGPKEERTSDEFNFWDIDSDRFKRLLEVNVFAPFLVAKTVVRDMVNQGIGTIVNIVTSPHTQQDAAHIPYGPSKAALEAMTKAMADQLANKGVRVNAVMPGGSANRRNEYLEDKSSFDGMPKAIVWLCSDESKNVSGQVFAGTQF
jgi:NAD(P)-dependent dehydrogenase (short-subunit alcohol dehydrogenase family)